MKKIICIVLVMISILSFAIAETDLSGFSYDQLIYLQKIVTLEIMSRPEWKSVEVPAGEWIVGVDIPAGYYSMSVKNTSGVVQGYDEQGKIKISQYIKKDEPFGKVQLIDGWCIKLSSATYLAPPLSLGF